MLSLYGLAAGLVAAENHDRPKQGRVKSHAQAQVMEAEFLEIIMFKLEPTVDSSSPLDLERPPESRQL